MFIFCLLYVFLAAIWPLFFDTMVIFIHMIQPGLTLHTLCQAKFLNTDNSLLYEVASKKAVHSQ